MPWIVVLFYLMSTLLGRAYLARIQPPELYVPVIHDVYAHDGDAFTQGLVWHEGTFYESTGLYGRSDLREVDPVSGDVIRTRALDGAYFAEGLALVDDRLIQITWRESTAFVYDRHTFDLLGEFSYDTEGWGLCYDGQRLVMSDGTSTLYFRDPDTFELLGTREVVLSGEPQAYLNELECVDGKVYANVWQTDYIVVIDPHSGRIETVIYAGGLLTDAERASADVLNGIALHPETGHFFITGKLWPKLFEVTFRAYEP